MSRDITRRNGSWIPTIATISALALVAAAFLILPGRFFSPEPAPSSTASSSGGVTPLPSSQVSFYPSAYRSINWRVTSLGADAAITDMAVADDRLIAVGSIGATPFAWISDDGGLGWSAEELVAPAPPVDDAQLIMGHVIASADRAIASAFWTLEGSADFNPVVFLSDDGGASWRAVTLDASVLGGRQLIHFEPIGTTDDGYLAVGIERQMGFGLWSFEFSDQSSGRWSEWTPEGLERAGSLSLALRGTEGVAVGSDMRGREQRPQFWWTGDLISWQPAVVNPEDQGVATSVGGFDNGWAAGGFLYSGELGQNRSWAVVWLSNDGRGWTTIPITQPEGWQVSGIAAGDAGVLAVLASTQQTEVRAAFIPAGTAAPSQTVVMPFAVTSVVSLRDRFVAAGRCQVEPGDSCDEGFVAIGTLSEDTNGTAPSLPPSPAPS